MRICIFEDEKSRNLFPLTLTRATFELRCGRVTLLERILNLIEYSGEVCLFVRDYIAPIVKLRYPNFHVNIPQSLKDDVLFVNGRLLYIEEEIGLDFSDEEAVFCEGELVYLKAKKETLSRYADRDVSGIIEELSQELSCRNIKASIINWPWDLITNNSRIIELDFRSLKRRGVFGKVKGKLDIIGEKDNIYIASGAKIYPNVVINVENGPVIIEEGAKVYSFSYIEGPSVIGRDTYIMPGARIRGGFSSGPVCRIGGEVEETIIHGYSNKYHDGFIGHSYIGEWVNLGALTTTSDLKNNYTEVTVYVNGKPVNTGLLKVGSFIGDHSRTGIGTLLNTGTIVGVMCNVIATDLSPKYIPSFTWFYRGELREAPGLEEELETARTMMSRRNKVLKREEVLLYKYLWEATREERIFYMDFYRRRYLKTKNSKEIRGHGC